ncbi:DUF1266 domain-containing protein [Variovorax sp. RKNM96]|uniref:DUF1266 domain-containing protein n=1 Tax=Variovorax sp. RKNM96 TaxID=2681552 RepID=UPI001981B543|nr:DUF1266 domain-containing protein [Variovorax sp. RKNM96]QSI29175.1 DUF1266 domain-containing protein [Variovorax sp. RKNM96]
MFKFFKELVDSVKEGMAEGRAELAQETADREAAQQENNAALAARLAASSRFENFAVALAAVYRQTFAPDLKEAHEAQRSAVHLLCIDIAPNEVEAWKKLLTRDFSVTNGEEAQTVVAEIVDDLASQASEDDLALWTGRAAHLATGAAAVGYASAEEALDWLEPAAELAIERFTGWDNYAQSFLAGERNAPGSNIVGRKLLASVAEKLLADELSPWKTVAWPARDSFTDLVASRAA